MNKLLTALILTATAITAQAAGEFAEIRGFKWTNNVKEYAVKFPLGLPAKQMLDELGMPVKTVQIMGMESALYHYGQPSAIEYYIKDGIVFDCKAWPIDPTKNDSRGELGLWNALATSDRKSVWNSEPITCSEIRS